MENFPSIKILNNKNGKALHFTGLRRIT